MKNLFVILLLFSFLTACTQSDEPGKILNPTEGVGNCNNPVKIDVEQYQAIDSLVGVSNLEIEGNCLLVEITDSGCSGETWEAQLIDSDSVYSGEIVKRKLKIQFTNRELCQAIVSKTFSFNIKPLQVKADSIRLYITNSDTPVDKIIYEY